MKLTHSTPKVTLDDDDSDGEEEVISTWKAKITEQNPNGTTTTSTTYPRQLVATAKMTAKQVSNTTSTLNSQRNIRPKPSNASSSSSKGRTAPQPPQTIAPATPLPSATKAAVPVVVAKPTPLKAIWYLGGNHLVKLLTSVDGDLDTSILGKIEAVPPVVGELALSVESLVSDDFTVGGFESDLLAKIASNTLVGKKPTAPAKPVTKLAPKTAAVVPLQRKPAKHAQQRVSSPLKASVVTTTTSVVPNPLAASNPVPNPLARITPPSSPSSFNSESSMKRRTSTATTTKTVKATKTSMSKKAKVARPTKATQPPMIQAR